MLYFEVEAIFIHSITSYQFTIKAVKPVKHYFELTFLKPIDFILNRNPFFEKKNVKLERKTKWHEIIFTKRCTK